MKFNLERSGMAPLAFEGKQIAKADGDRNANRWHDLAIYETTAGNLVLSIKYQTDWENEVNRSIAFIFCEGDLQGRVIEKLTYYDPSMDVRGYPVGEHYAEKQHRLLQDIKQRYDAQVSSLLGQVPDFHEKVA